MPGAEGPPEPPVRREVVDILRQALGARPGPLDPLSAEDRDLMGGATEAEKHVAAHELLRDMAKAANNVVMTDWTTADLPDDPDWA